ncbi:TPA: O-antigen polymerase [Streptococcus suis]
MIYFVLFLVLLLLVVSYLLSKTLLNPIVMFLCLWSVILLFSSLGLYNMNKVSEKTYILILLGIIAFVIGGVISFSLLSVNGSIQKNIQLNLNYNHSIARICLGISFIGMLYLFLTSLQLLLQGYNLNQIHNMFYGYGEHSMLLSDTVHAIINWICLPLLYVSLFYASINIFNRKYSYFFILTFFTLFLYLIGNASRVMLGIVAINFLILMKFYNINLSKKFKKKIRQAIILFVLFFIFLTLSRINTQNSNNVNSLYAYFTIPVNLFDYWINWFDSVGAEHTNGGAFVFGFLSWINFFMEKIGINFLNYNTISEYIMATQNRWINVFPGKSYNAFVTMFYYFYMDLGSLGIVIGSSLFGFISYYTYFYSVKIRNANNLLYYLFIVQCILTSFVRWQIGSVSFVVELIAIMMISAKIRFRVGRKN